MWIEVSSVRLKCRKLAGEFVSSTGGNTAVIFGIAAIPLFGALGVAVDFARIDKTRSTIQSAMDASVLAGLAAQSGSEIATATRIFNANLNDPSAALNAPAYTLDTSCGCLTGTVSGSISMALMAVLGISTMPLNISAKATNKHTATKPLTVTVTPTKAHGWYPKVLYVWTKDSSGAVTSMTQMLTYDFQFTPSQYGWTVPALNVASARLTLDPNYQSWGYKVRVYYGTALGDQSQAGLQGPYYDMWSDALPPPPVQYQTVTLQGDVRSHKTCDDKHGQTINIEDGGDNDYQDMVLQLTCTTGRATVAGTPYLIN